MPLLQEDTFMGIDLMRLVLVLPSYLYILSLITFFITLTESFDEVSATKVCVYKYDPEFKFTDPKLIEHLTSMDHPNRENVNEFLLCLSLCHSVIPGTST